MFSVNILLLIYLLSVKNFIAPVRAELGFCLLSFSGFNFSFCFVFSIFRCLPRLKFLGWIYWCPHFSILDFIFFCFLYVVDFLFKIRESLIKCLIQIIISFNFVSGKQFDKLEYIHELWRNDQRIAMWFSINSWFFY